MERLAGDRARLVARLLDSGLRRAWLPALVLAGAAGAAWWYFLRADPGDLDAELADRGKILVIGSSHGLGAAGATLVPETDEPAIAKLLAGRDEAALVKALRAKNFRAVLADASIADPGTLPRASLRNAFAMTRPLARFTAVDLADAASLWEMHEPFDVPHDDAKTMIDVARLVLAGRDPPEASDLAPSLSAPRGSEVAVVLREQGPAIIWRSAKRASLYESAVEGAKVLRDRWQVRQRRRFGPLADALDHLNVEIEIFHDIGELTSRSNALAVRAIEPGIFGAMIGKGTDYRYLLPSVAAHQSQSTAIEVLEAVSKEADLEADGWQRPGEKLYRYRTVHWRETAPRGPIVRLERGIPPVGEAVLTRHGLLDVLDLATSWLVRNQEDDGQYAYKYFPEKDQWLGKRRGRKSTAQNIVRHGLATYGTVLAYEMVAKEEYLEAAKRAIDFLRASTKRGMGPPTGRGRARGPSDSWEGKRIPRDMAFVESADNNNEGVGLTAKAAATAAAILAISELALATGWTPELRSEIDAYGKFLLFLQKEDGSFWNYYVAPEHPRFGEESSIFPGEILFALSRAHLATGDRAYRAAFVRGTKFYDDWYRSRVEDRGWDGNYSETIRLDLVQFVPWISMAMNDMVQRENRREWAEFGIHGAEWIVREYQYGRSRAFFPDYLGAYFKSVSELPAMHGCVYTEGTAAGYNLARLTNQTARRRVLRRATLLGCRFAAQQLIRPGVSDFYFPNPSDADGGIRYGLADNHLRTDYTYHSLSAIYQALKYMPAEDLPP